MKHFLSHIYSIRFKITLLIVASLTIFAILSAIMCYGLYTNSSIDQNKKIAASLANLAATLINPENIDIYINQGKSNEEYRSTREKLYEIKKNIDSIQYIYVYKIKKDGCHVVFDIDDSNINETKPGEIIPFDHAFSKYIPDLLAGKKIEPIISDETFGWLLTAYAPIYDKENICQCYVGIDISMAWLKEDAYKYIMNLLLIFVILLITILSISVLLANRGIINPINDIAYATSLYDFDSTTFNNLEKTLHGITSVKINTKDEIENLHHSFVSMVTRLFRSLKDIQDKNSTILQMQDALIISLADMVESRDKTTGLHIKKTAAYTKIIMHEMKRLGIYTDTLTNDFMRNVERSAPLHDIGKINVPDAILNKPTKLTPEEFDQMKSHTTIGGEIIKHIISTVPDPDYLYEAQNLATYHHEKWDGTGYPEGLAGDAIPLSARIMSVADVFDALVSTRSYKKGFPYETAFDIISQNSGSQFDPQIVTAFLHAKQKVIKVADHFEKMKD